jgi:hypothetical protein
MNDAMKDRQRFWLVVGEYYGHQFTEGQLRMYAEDVLDFDLQDLQRAFVAYRRINAKAFLPRPGELIQCLDHGPSLLSQAVEASGRIVQALGRIPDPVEARAFIGELGWKVVERDGGWARLRQNTMEADKGRNKAQWREMALAIAERAQFGLMDTPPSLPGPKTNRLSDLIKTAFPGLVEG